MSYRDIIGILKTNPNEEFDTIKRDLKQYKNESHGYDHVRLGIPLGVLDFEGLKNEREKLLKHFISNGYSTWPRKDISMNLAQHVAQFRASLDIYEEFCKSRVFSKDEIYFRCLSEGPSFTNFIKKSRSTCLRAFTAETDTEIEEEYYHESYTGYNSIIHERYLIHWDERKSAMDYPYSMIPNSSKQRNINTFEKYLDEMFEEYRLDEIEGDIDIDMIKGLQPTKMYDSKLGKTRLMRDFWSDDIDTSGPYFAKRAVVPIEPGNLRDTGIGDPSSILKIKLLNTMARKISDKLPHSANTDGPTANARYKRVLKKNSFLHLDFKKYGLTFPRRLQNSVIKRIGKSLNIDVEDLLIKEFYLEVDGKAIRTERGSVLGWLDPIGAIGVSAILCHLSRSGLNFDHIGFNDDFEISKRAISDIPGTLSLLRIAVVTEIDSWDIPISMSKTYGSKASVFLERYSYFSRHYNLDMYKEQLTIKAYARSLVTRDVYQAKLFFAAAWEWTKNDYVRDRCIDTCPIEFRKEEINLPLWAGGWTLQMKKGQDYSLENSDSLGIRLGCELSKFKPKRYSTKPQKVSSHSEIINSSNKKGYEADSSELHLHTIDFSDSIEKINEETEWYVSAVRTLADVFEGRNTAFAELVVQAVEEAAGAKLDPG